MRRSFLPVMLALLPSVAAAGPSFSVFVHPDDCILFMNPALYDDSAKEAQKVVMVYLTSGDAGEPFSTDTSPTAYPHARELAALEATRWMADANRLSIRTQQQEENVRIAGHPIARFSYANTVSYFLRLPDGNYAGDGFARYGNQSLRKLKSGEITSITPIDGSATYTGWSDLVSVLSSIVTRETPDAREVTLHISDPDTHANSNDHSDHTTGARGVMAMLAQQQGQACYTLYKHIDYAIEQKPVNLEGDALASKAGSFAVLTAAQRRHLDFHHWDKAHVPYLTRDYVTRVTLPEGCERAR